MIDCVKTVIGWVASNYLVHSLPGYHSRPPCRPRYTRIPTHVPGGRETQNLPPAQPAPACKNHRRRYGGVGGHPPSTSPVTSTRGATPPTASCRILGLRTCLRRNAGVLRLQWFSTPLAPEGCDTLGGEQGRTLVRSAATHCETPRARTHPSRIGPPSRRTFPWVRCGQLS